MYGIDTPIIYFIESQREVKNNIKLVKEVIDGRQRLSTIFRFLKNDLKLIGLKQKTPHYEDLEGKSFKEIPKKYQNVFKSYSIRTVSFKLIDANVDIDTQLKFKYQLFYRYNSGLTALNQQEVRNCMYHNDKYLIMFKEIASHPTFLNVCPFFREEVRMADTEFVSLLYFLTVFDDGLKLYSTKWKNYFINECYKRIKSEIYSFESYFDKSNESNMLSVSDENELTDDSYDEDNESDMFFSSTKNEILEKLNFVYQIYGKYLTGERMERYIIESLYYNIYRNKKRINKHFIKSHANALGKHINDCIVNSQSNISGSDFTLWDTFNDRVTDSVRVNYRFNKVAHIIDSFFKQKGF